MPDVLKRPLARADLAEIWSYIASDSEAAADRFLDSLEAKLRMLSTQPRLGRARPELMAALRSFPIGSYIVFYLPLADGIDIVRVLHGSRDIGPDDFLAEGSA